MSQREAAKKFRVTLYEYRKWETDTVPYPRQLLDIGKLKQHEACFIARRREGLTLTELSECVGISVNWLCEIERGEQPADKLVKYWKSRR